MSIKLVIVYLVLALTLHIDGKAIQSINCCKHLGIMIDNDLKWKTDIDFIYNKLIKFVSIFYRTKLCNTRNTFCGTWYLPHSHVHNERTVLL